MQVDNSTALSAQISALSRAKAANGDGNFSAETLRAINNGAVAPSVARPVPETEKSNQVENQEPSETAVQLSSTGTIDGLSDSGLSSAAQSLPIAGAVLPDAGSVLNIVV